MTIFSNPVELFNSNTLSVLPLMMLYVMSEFAPASASVAFIVAIIESTVVFCNTAMLKVSDATDYDY